MAECVLVKVKVRNIKYV